MHSKKWLPKVDVQNGVIFQKQTLPALQSELMKRIQAFVSKVNEFVTKMFDELIPPLKWSSWALEDNPPPLNVIESWYSGTMESAHRVSDSLTNFLRQFRCDRQMGMDWKTCATKAVQEVKIIEKLSSLAIQIILTATDAFPCNQFPA